MCSQKAVSSFTGTPSCIVIVTEISPYLLFFTSSRINFSESAISVSIGTTIQHLRSSRTGSNHRAKPGKQISFAEENMPAIIYIRNQLFPAESIQKSRTEFQISRSFFNIHYIHVFTFVHTFSFHFFLLIK